MWLISGRCVKQRPGVPGGDGCQEAVGAGGEDPEVKESMGGGPGGALRVSALLVGSMTKSCCSPGVRPNGQAFM